MNYKLEHLDIEISKACNLACIHCSAKAGKDEQKPNLKLIKGILTEAKQMGLRRVGITGGEPLLFPKELSDLINFSVEKLGVSVHMHTNGTLIEQNWSLVKDSVKKIDNITLPLLGGTKETHSSNCKSDGAYEKVLTAAKILVKHSVPTTLFLIPMSTNVSDLAKGVEPFHKIGIRNYRVMILTPGGRARNVFEQLSLDENQKKHFESELNLLEEKLGIKFEAGFCTRLFLRNMSVLKGHDLCMSAIDRLHINSNGYVFPCTAASGLIEMNMGDIHQQSLKDIWLNSKGLKEIREFKEKRPNKCVGCGDYFRCLGGCRVRSYYKNGNLNSVDCFKN
ncbi:MAG TPA: radical SAM protein [Candidatus Portnoybacteria bacterium]|nr:radical SAM protein [Candidatus Portnoybacteria bacterium]